MQAPGDTAATTFTYTSDDARKTTTYPNGVVITASWEDGSSGNTGPGRLKSIVTKKGATTLASFTYGFTPSAGCAQGSADTPLRQSMTTPSGTANYCYDALGRLTSASGHNGKSYTYTLDGNGNITKAVRDGATTSFGYNEADELCWSVGSSQASSACSPAPTGATTYSSDADGNLTTSSAAFAASYNVREQATSMTSLSGTSSTALSYSGPNQNERVSAGSTTFLNNALGVSAETTAGATTRYRRDNEGGLVSERLSSNAIHYYAFDGLGSVTGLTDSTGAMPTTYTYDPYGATSSSGTTPNPWRYAATYQDPTGFYKMGMRYYSPSLMRWSQPDPVEQLTDATQAMRFGYAGGDPVNAVDPDGTFLEAIAALPEIAGAAVVAGAAAYATYKGIQYVKESRGQGGNPDFTGPKRRHRNNRDESSRGPESKGRRGPFRKRPPGHKGPWPPPSTR
jgi:RHS repeat-associated protein